MTCFDGLGNEDHSTIPRQDVGTALLTTQGADQIASSELANGELGATPIRDCFMAAVFGSGGHPVRSSANRRSLARSTVLFRRA